MKITATFEYDDAYLTRQVAELNGVQLPGTRTVTVEDLKAALENPQNIDRIGREYLERTLDNLEAGV